MRIIEERPEEDGEDGMEHREGDYGQRSDVHRFPNDPGVPHQGEI